MRYRYVVALVTIGAALFVTTCDRADIPTPGSDERRVQIKLRNFEFQPDPIKVEVGEVVGFELSSADIRHTFTVTSAEIDVEVHPGRPFLQRATFGERGEFVIICTVPGHAKAGMVGTLIVR